MRSLKVGDVVLIRGEVYTGRDAVHAEGDYEFHFWEASTGAEFIGVRVQNRWRFEEKQNAKWHPTPATSTLINLAEELIAQREANRTS